MPDPDLVLDALYERVTAAIIEAEHEESADDDIAAQYAYLTVSFLEEDIAQRIEAINPEGAIARRGAITAALRSRQYERAVDVSKSYLAEQLPDALKSQILALLSEAESFLVRPRAPDPLVRPRSTFILEAVGP